MKHVLLIVCGSIAAYKGLDITRRLKDLGVEVRVVLTPAAAQFVCPQSFSVLSENDAYVTEFCDTPSIIHIELARWADVVCIAPASANTIAKFAAGCADNLALSCLLATRAPICVAPAMNTNMLNHAATQHNISVLRARGVHFIKPDSGPLACGEVGAGKLPDPDDIARFAYSLSVCAKDDLRGQTFLITAGPTQESIDPVRCISNFSTGKMGCALVRAAKARGACVRLIAGPLSCSYPSCDAIYRVKSAQEMYECAQRLADTTTIAICTAAVADWTPAHYSSQKIKKTESDEFLLTLKKAPDILHYLSHQNLSYVIGFAAETNNLIEHAKQKLIRKGCDLIVANDISKRESSFGSETNCVSYVYPEGVEESHTQNLTLVAHDILDHIVGAIKPHSTREH